MSIITLTTDLGFVDQYVAQIKAKIITQLPDIKIIDISHEIKKHNIQHASYVLKNCYNDFPQNVIVYSSLTQNLEYLTQHYNLFNPEGVIAIHKFTINLNSSA